MRILEIFFLPWPHCAPAMPAMPRQFSQRDQREQPQEATATCDLHIPIITSRQPWRTTQRTTTPHTTSRRRWTTSGGRAMASCRKCSARARRTLRAPSIGPGASPSCSLSSSSSWPLSRVSPCRLATRLVWWHHGGDFRLNEYSSCVGSWCFHIRAVPAVFFYWQTLFLAHVVPQFYSNASC